MQKSFINILSVSIEKALNNTPTTKGLLNAGKRDYRRTFIFLPHCNVLFIDFCNEHEIHFF